MKFYLIDDFDNKIQFTDTLVSLQLDHNQTIIDIYDNYNYYVLPELEDNSRIKTIVLYVNGEELHGVFRNNRFEFDRKIFEHVFCFAYAILIVKMIDGSTVKMSAGIFNVLTQNTENIENVNNMVEYIYQNQFGLLYDGSLDSYSTTNFRKTQKTTLDTQIELIKNIIQCYARHYEYFKNNAKSKLYTVSKIDDYSKLTSVNKSTLRYIIEHPDNLRQSKGAGFKYAGKTYLPDKVLTSENIQSLDIYENQQIIGFLYEILFSIAEYKTEIQKRKIASRINDKDAYVSYVKIIYGIVEKRLESYEYVLGWCEQKIKDILVAYQQIFPFHAQRIVETPRMTHVFAQIEAYSNIYSYMIPWFNLGIYNFEYEAFVTPFLTNNLLYEYYLLVKLYNYFYSRGCTPIIKSAHTYRDRQNQGIADEMSQTQFLTPNGNVIELFYQPRIYCESKKNKNIALIRNNQLSMGEGDEIRGSYYHPDFVVKIQNSAGDAYVIIDAKFSKKNTVKSFYMPPLIYKYIFSLSTINDKDKIAGLCAINGKPGLDENNSFESIYVSQAPIERLPFVDIITLHALDKTEENETMQFNNFDKIFNIQWESKVHRSPLRFNMIDIPVDAEIEFINDRSIKVRVAPDLRNVIYDGKKTSMSALAQELLQVNYNIPGTEYFMYNGEKLTDRRKRYEKEGKL